MSLASYDQFTDFQKIDSKIILSTRSYNKLCNLIRESNKLKCETGVFFMGKEINEKNSNEILVEDYTTDLKKSSAFFKGGAMEDTPESQKMREICSQKFGMNCMFHFHVHIKPQGSYYDIFSDDDLKVLKQYATRPHFQYFTKDDLEKILERKISDIEYQDFINRMREARPLFDNLTLEQKKKINKGIVKNRRNNYFLILATPNRSDTINNYQLSVIYGMPYVNSTTGEIEIKIYNFSNIYYIDNDKIYRVGEFVRQNAPILSTGRRITKIKVPIQAIGRDPRTGNTIEDMLAGTYTNDNVEFNQGEKSTRR